MKNNKKFILAAGAAALGLVAATGVTSGFAWFATNSTVSVRSFNFKANSDNEFLLIGYGETDEIAELRNHANGTKPNKSVTIDETGVNAKSYKPVTYLGDDDGANAIGNSQTSTNYKTGSGSESDRVGRLDYYPNWGTATTDVWDNASVNIAGTPFAAATTAETFGQYVGVYTFYLGLESGSADVNGIYVRSVSFTNGNKGATLIIAGTEGGVLFTDDLTTPSQVNLTGALSGDNVVTVKAYVYLDGRNAEVKSSQAASLADTIEFVLGTNYNAQ